MQSYLITDPKYYSNNPTKFTIILNNTLHSHAVDMACFRDKSSNNFKELAKVFVETCKKNSIKKYFINGDYLLASELNATGVHLTSTQFDHIKKAKELGLEVIISTHNKTEIQQAIEGGADYITYSPIFTTPNKGEPKGVKDLQNICKQYPQMKIIALGGIVNDNQINEIKKEANPFGFASIRYFVKE